MNDQLAALANRVETLEKNARRWKSIAALFVVGLVVAGAVGAADRPKETVARKFTVIDSRGKPRIVMDATGPNAEINLFDQAGEKRATLGSNKDGSPFLVMFDQEQRQRIRAMILPGIGPMLQSLDEKGETIIPGQAPK